MTENLETEGQQLEDLINDVLLEEEQPKPKLPPISEQERDLVKTIVARVQAHEAKKRQMEQPVRAVMEDTRIGTAMPATAVAKKVQQDMNTISKRQAAVEVMVWLKKMNMLTLVAVITLFVSLAPVGAISMAGGAAGIAFCMWNYVASKRSMDYLKANYGI